MTKVKAKQMMATSIIKSLLRADWHRERCFLYSTGDAGIISILWLREQTQRGCSYSVTVNNCRHTDDYEKDEDAVLFLEDLRILWEDVLQESHLFQRDA